MELLLEMLHIDFNSAVDITTYLLLLLSFGIAGGLIIRDAAEGFCLTVYDTARFIVWLLKKLLIRFRRSGKERNG